MIREVKARDKEHVSQLYGQLYPKYKNQVVDLSRSSFAADYLPLIYLDNENQQAVGLVTGVIIKFGRLKQGYIEDLVVSADYRGQGVGKQLVNNLLARFKEQNIEVVFVATDFQSEEEDPTKFYEALGFHEMRNPWFVKKLNN